MKTDRRNEEARLISRIKTDRWVVIGWKTVR